MALSVRVALLGLLVSAAAPANAYGSIVVEANGDLLISPDGPIPEPSPLHMNKVELSKALDEVAQRTGRAFVLRRGLKGVLSIQSDALLSLDDVFNVAIQALAENDVHIVRNRSGLSVVKDKGCGGEYQTPDAGDWLMPETLTEVIPFKRIEPELAVRLASSLYRRGDEAVALPPMRIMLSSWSSEDADRIKKALLTLDQSGPHEVYQFILLEEERAEDLAQLLRDNVRGNIVVMADRPDRVLVGMQAAESSRVDEVVQKSGLKVSDIYSLP